MTGRRRVVWSAIAAVTGALAYGTTTRGARGADDSPPITTDSLVYHLRYVGAPGRVGSYEASAVATYVNRTRAPVRYARCRGDRADRLYPLAWLRRTGPDSTRRAMLGIVCWDGVPNGTVPPGGTLRVEVYLGGLESPGANPPILPEDRIGRFRIELALCAATTSSEDCRHLPQARRESNAFEVRFADPPAR